MVMEENQIMKRPKATHWGLSLTISRVSRSPSSTSVGSTGLAFRTVVRRFTWSSNKLVGIEFVPRFVVNS